jgi:hypothetical protein
VAVLIENGGRLHQLNKSVSSDTSMLVRPLLDVLDSQDLHASQHRRDGIGSADALSKEAEKRPNPDSSRY